MGKTVKTIGIAIAVGAITGGIGGFFAPALTATVAGTTLTGVAAGAFMGAVGGLVSSGLGLVTKSFTKKPSMNMEQAIGRLNLSTDPTAMGKFVFGETAAPTDIIYAEQHGGKSQYVSQIVAVAAHRIYDYLSLYVQDEEISFSGAAATGAWASTLWRNVSNLGADGQSALSGSIAFSWPSTAKGRGFAHYLLQWQLGKPKTESGLPSRITQVVKGMPVYDPRTDTTRGGSGSHRADDQSTWEYTNGTNGDIGANWALVVVAYLLGWRTEDGNDTLIFGMGVDPDDIDWDSVMAAANVCDEFVDGKLRFRIGGVLPTDQSHENTLRQLEAAIGGRVSKFGGKYYIWAPNDDLVATETVTDDDLVREVGVEFIPSGPIENLYNTARGMYISADDLYQPVSYPEVVESTAVTEDGRSRVMEHNFSIVQDVEIAERVARMLVRRSRFTATWRFGMGPKGLLFRPFSVLNLSIQETNYGTVTVRVIGMTYSLSGVVVLEVIEEDSSIYDTTEPLGTPVTQLDPSSFDSSTIVSVSNLAVSATSITGSAGTASDALSVTWDDPGTLVSITEVRYRKNGTTDWLLVPPAQVDFTKAIIPNVEPGTTYNVEARHITMFGAKSSWSSTVNGTSGTAQISKGIVNQGTLATINTVGTGHIDDSAVTTKKVVSEAIINPEYAHTSGNLGLTGSWQAVQEVTVEIGDSDVGGPWPVEIIGQFLNSHVGSGNVINYRINRDTTTIYGPVIGVVNTDLVCPCAMLDDPGPGTYSYSIDAIEISGSSHIASERFLSVKGIKR